MQQIKDANTVTFKQVIDHSVNKLLSEMENDTWVN